MFEGINASDGYGIGVAQVAVAPDLSFTPTAPTDLAAEKSVTHRRYKNLSIKQTRKSSV